MLLTILSTVSSKVDNVQLFVEGGGAVAITSSLFYLGRVLGRLDNAVTSIDARVQRIETVLDKEKEAT